MMALGLLRVVASFGAIKFINLMWAADVQGVECHEVIHCVDFSGEALVKIKRDAFS